ncbi:MAG: TRCF domain-containing protein [Microthrixaceae bacterium]
MLYQQRLNAQGPRYEPDTPWQSEMEASFPFQETPDQLKAIADVKADMEASTPMDRLVCGDVGFGKTEVAVRAAFKAIQAGKQVAVLVPTTLLAQQHHQTFAERFSGYPVRVEVLSRFLSDAQARKVTAGIRDGSVDLVIGTHRLLSADIEFKSLGLLVVDEEQRFGVTHKEAIKALKADVDVLTLTATPIPRTLEMSLTGIRDLSLLETAPAARRPILTYVGSTTTVPWPKRSGELLREGQVFYVHNRVRDIEHRAERIRDLVPEARIAIAHGQMDEGTLERVVVDFWEGLYDVLVCTTIIESGIDMPTVNTLVVEQADLLGLGQLHQLRGRVGRGAAGLRLPVLPQDRQLSEEAYERLKTIGETTELGSGFRIAMRDLEIRGAGNLLGTGQTGHVAAVGYDLYVQMVHEAIAELNGDRPPEAAPEVTVEIPGSAGIPTDYMSRDDLRLDTYRRLAAVTDPAEVDEIASELSDRFGPVPQPVVNLLAVARDASGLCATGNRRGAGDQGADDLGRWTDRQDVPGAARAVEADAPRAPVQGIVLQGAERGAAAPPPGKEPAPVELAAAIDRLMPIGASAS